MGLMGAVSRAPVSRLARLEALAYLLMPLWQGIVGITLVAAIALAVTGQFRFWGEGPWWQLLFFYLLGFGGTVLGCIAARGGKGARGWPAGFALGQVYATGRKPSASRSRESRSLRRPRAPLRRRKPQQRRNFRNPPVTHLGPNRAACPMRLTLTANIGGKRLPTSPSAIGAECWGSLRLP
jgi:hypothetical protein